MRNPIRRSKPSKTSGVTPVNVSTASANNQPRDLTMRQAKDIAFARLRRKNRDAIDRYIRQDKAWHRVRTLLLVAAFAAMGVLAYQGQSKPLHQDQLKSQVRSLQKQVKTLQTTGYPVAAAVGAATPKVYDCLTYSDQLSSDQIQTLSDECGWSGHGVANLVGAPYFDPDPNLMAHVVSGRYAAVPFRIHLSNAPTALLYYVPVIQTGPTTARVFGQGGFFLSAPGFIAVNNTVNDTATQVDVSTSPIDTTINQFMKGASRYTMPGVNIPVSNASLKVSSLTDYVVYNGTATNCVASALVTYNGPTRDAQFTQRIAFKLNKPAGSADWVVEAIGPDTNTTLGGD